MALLQACRRLLSLHRVMLTGSGSGTLLNGMDKTGLLHEHIYPGWSLFGSREFEPILPSKTLVTFDRVPAIKIVQFYDTSIGET
jgi:hypothetical protein